MARGRSILGYHKLLVSRNRDAGTVDPNITDLWLCWAAPQGLHSASRTGGSSCETRLINGIHYINAVHRNLPKSMDAEHKIRACCV